MWTVYGEVFLTSHGSDTTYFQKMTPQTDLVLEAIRTWIIQYNDPSYTSVALKIYSDNAGSPRALIATSASRTKAQLFSAQNSGNIESYFTFSPNVVLKSGTTYHVVLSIAGYTGTESSHLAWKHSYPDPVYQTSVNMTFEGLHLSPFDLTLIAAEL